LATATSKSQPRLRVFAGPNGSGKSTIIKAVAATSINGKKIDLGTYINADDIATALLKNKFSFFTYKITTGKKQILDFAAGSGLLNAKFTRKQLSNCFTLQKSHLRLKEIKWQEQLAQILARFLRECMLKENRRFSFETVFSHPSNLDIMRQAVAAGYKVYLYFVATESPAINKYRVQLRVAQKGHQVPEDKIESRYFRSLGLLYQAAENAYQAFSLIIQQAEKVPISWSIILKNRAIKKYGIYTIKKNLRSGLKNITGAKEQKNDLYPPVLSGVFHPDSCRDVQICSGLRPRKLQVHG
jgi:predicted ABC-type ATPase